MTKRGFALIGAGLFGERHAQAYSRHHAVDFVAVCDLNLPRAELIADRYGAGYATDDLNRVLADPAVTAVSIATPDHLHRDPLPREHRMIPPDAARFRKFKTRRKGKVQLVYWQDKMTGHLYATATPARRAAA